MWADFKKEMLAPALKIELRLAAKKPSALSSIMYVGYRMERAYYTQAPDKTQDLINLLTCVTPRLF